MSIELDRRDVLKGAAVAAGAAATMGITAASATEEELMSGALLNRTWAFEIPPAPITDDQITETFEAEVVVVGGGTAGLVAANAAMDFGADVILFSGSSKAIARGGSNNAAYSKAMEAAGLPRLNVADIQKEIFSNYNAVDQRKWYLHYNRSEEAMNWLIDVLDPLGFHCGIEQSNYYKTDSLYYSPANSHAWCLKENIGGQVGRNQPDVVAALAQRLVDGGAQVHWCTAGYQLVREDDNTGRVSAVIARRLEDDTYVKYVATKGIIMATGDFSADRDMMAKYATPYFHYVSDEVYDEEPDYDKEAFIGGLFHGDMHKAALWVGAAWQKTLPNPTMCGNICPGASVNRSQGFFGLMLNREGKRFMNEYCSRALGPLNQMLNPGGISWAIWDTDWATHFEWYQDRYEYMDRENHKYTQEEVVASWDEKAEKGDYLKADTIEELVELMGLPECAVESVARYNEMVAAGADTDFYKDSDVLFPVATPPFYAEKADNSKPRFYTILGGLRTNDKMQVCDADDQPIEGLYNVGTMVGDLFAGRYTFNIQGANYGMACVTFGYLTGKLLAEM